jgi:hypothetical protein
MNEAGDLYRDPGVYSKLAVIEQYSYSRFGLFSIPKILLNLLTGLNMRDLLFFQVLSFFPC